MSLFFPNGQVPDPFPKGSEKSLNSVEPDQTVQSDQVYTVCHSVCIFWAHYSDIKPNCSTFRIITANFSGFRIFRFFTVNLPETIEIDYLFLSKGIMIQYYQTISFLLDHLYIKLAYRKLTKRDLSFLKIKSHEVGALSSSCVYTISITSTWRKQQSRSLVQSVNICQVLSEGHAKQQQKLNFDMNLFIFVTEELSP